jgi:hypothetical protein
MNSTLTAEAGSSRLSNNNVGAIQPALADFGYQPELQFKADLFYSRIQIAKHVNWRPYFVIDLGSVC